MDGVLAVGPQQNETPWRHMKGLQRKAHLDSLIEWYANAPRIYAPSEPAFLIVTARKNSAAVREATLNWIHGAFPNQIVTLEMLDKSRSIENVVEFKTAVLRKYQVEDYTEDNRKIVNALRKTVPKCRVWHFKNGQQILDYDWFPNIARCPES